MVRKIRIYCLHYVTLAFMHTPLQAAHNLTHHQHIALVTDDVKPVTTCKLHMQFLLPLQRDLCRHTTRDGLQHAAVEADQGVVQLLQGPQDGNTRAVSTAHIGCCHGQHQWCTTNTVHDMSYNCTCGAQHS